MSRELLKKLIEEVESPYHDSCISEKLYDEVKAELDKQDCAVWIETAMELADEYADARYRNNDDDGITARRALLEHLNTWKK